MTAPTSFPSNFLEDLGQVIAPSQCIVGEAFDHYLTADERAEFERVARETETPLARLRRFFAEQTGQSFSKDSFNRHMRQECPCE